MKTVKLLMLAVVISLASCNKDQKAVNQLEGDWKITSLKVDGVAQPSSDYENTTYTFEKCKVKNGDCPGKITEDGKSFDFTYNVSEKGEKMTIKFDILGTKVTTVADILESSKTKFVWKSIEDGETVESTIEKK